MFVRNDFAAAWMNLGIVLSAQHNYNKAEDAYLKALQHRKSYPHCYFNLGNLVRILNKFDYTNCSNYMVIIW